MKKVWSAPKAVAEQFVPNEYVAACWGIKCDVAGHDGFGQDTNDGHRNQSGCCGDINTQFVQALGNDIYQIVEQNDGYGNMGCTIYPDGFDYANHKVNGTGQSTIKITNSMLTNGRYTLYWTTAWTDGKTGDQYTWYHYGTVNLTGNTVQHS